jgi:hypothetical protein
MMSREKVYNAAMADYDSELALQRHAFQQAEIFNDVAGQAAALKEMAAIEVQKRAAHQMAVNDARQMQATRVATNRYGLSPEEVDIAHKSYVDRSGRDGLETNLTNDQKEALYSRNKEKLRQMKATRQYDDTQGQVFKGSY